MNRAYAVAGAALTGVLTGGLATGLWQWAEQESARLCADTASLCLPPYPLIGIAVWVAVTVPVFVVALRLLGLGPRTATVPTSFALQAYVLAILGPLSAHGYPETDAPNLAALACGPGLVALATVPRWRRAALAALGLLLVSSFLLYGLAEGFPF
ncbi:hypothetical protein ACWGB8_18850 [Kitasatospora sp. NPDC054939]